MRSSVYIKKKKESTYQGFRCRRAKASPSTAVGRLFSVQDGAIEGEQIWISNQRSNKDSRSIWFPTWISESNPEMGLYENHFSS